VQAFVCALGKEVSDRLKADSLLGRSLTLSVMRRAHNAPAEPPKFLGHGSCDSFTYSAFAVGPRGTGTSEPEVISATAWQLLQAHHLADVTDLRGIGISVTHLELAKAARYSEQSKLSFELKSSLSPEIEGSNRHSHIANDPSVDLTVLEDDTPITPRKLSSLNASTDTQPISKQRTPSPRHTSSPTKFRIFAVHQQIPTCISDADLREIDIDPNVFHSLPSDIQREQLNIRQITAKTPQEDVDALSKQRDSRSRSRSRSLSAAPSTFASLTDAPDAKVNARVAPLLALKKARTIEELQDLISRWMESGLESGPEVAATESIRDFFFRCMAQQGDVAIDKVATVLKWWRSISRVRWPVDESDMRSQDVTADYNVGQMWWHAFTTVKDAVDQTVRGRFGGTLSLQ
jgi:DNA repair protein REV1